MDEDPLQIFPGRNERRFRASEQPLGSRSAAAASFPGPGVTSASRKRKHKEISSSRPHGSHGSHGDSSRTGEVIMVPLEVTDEESPEEDLPPPPSKRRKGGLKGGSKSTSPKRPVPRLPGDEDEPGPMQQRTRRKRPLINPLAPQSPDISSLSPMPPPPPPHRPPPHKPKPKRRLPGTLPQPSHKPKPTRDALRAQLQMDSERHDPLPPRVDSRSNSNSKFSNANRYSESRQPKPDLMVYDKRHPPPPHPSPPPPRGTANAAEIARKQGRALPDKDTYRIICFDTETTGFGSTGEIIDIGAVELLHGKKTGWSFQSYVKPTSRIHPAASRVHGLTENSRELRAAENLQFVTRQFLEWCNSPRQCWKQGCDDKHPIKFVAHNAIWQVSPFHCSHFMIFISSLMFRCRAHFSNV